HPQVGFIAGLTQTDQHFAQLAEAIAPQGKIALIDDPSAIDVRLLKGKSASLHWEFMFTRSMFTTPDIAQQGKILQQVAQLLDEGKLSTTLSETLHGLS
ncbi:zinc-binding dehydrogenase, partial [Escherichia coli]|uniref:zinc-binding dehydrogenase n=1 Tax=Escherichia coli TaxID=562 RepID=UPI002282C718